MNTVGKFPGAILVEKKAASLHGIGGSVLANFSAGNCDDVVEEVGRRDTVRVGLPMNVKPAQTERNILCKLLASRVIGLGRVNVGPVERVTVVLENVSCVGAEFTVRVRLASQIK